MRIRYLGLPVAAAAVFVLAGCGDPAGDGIASAGGGTASPSASASTSPSLSPEEGALKFAQCMRRHGVDMPDPKINGGKIDIQVKAKGVPRAKLDTAQKACQQFLAAGGKGPLKQDPQARAEMLKFTQCMRQHGINLPDPKPGQGLKLSYDGPRAKLEAAQKACAKYQPGGGRGTTRVGGGA